MKTLVVGIGSTILGDDGAGVYAARQIEKELERDDLAVVEVGTAGLGLIDFVEGYDRLIVLDAIATGARPGTVHVLTGQQVARSAHLGCDHGACLPAVLAAGRALANAHMPSEVFVVAVEAQNLTGFSETLTPQVRAALPNVVAAVKEIVDESE